MSAAIPPISDERLAEIVGAGVPCVPIEPWEVAHVVQELRSLRAYRTAANPLQAVLDKFPVAKGRPR